MCNNNPSKNLSKKRLDAPIQLTRRKRLWELPESFHCPIIGVCLPIPILRTLVEKHLGKVGQVTHYDLHSYAVGQSAQRNALSERLENALNQRFAHTIRQCRAFKSSDELRVYWQGAVGQGDVAGALWAVLTHPEADAYFSEAVCRDMHMIQHQAGAATRVDIQRYHEISEENAILTRELGQVQERCTRLLQHKAQEIEHLRQSELALRGQLMHRDHELHFLREEFDQLRASIPELQTRETLQARLEELQTRFEQQNKLLQQTSRERDQALERLLHPPLQNGEPTPSVCVKENLCNKAILCVGGRVGEMAKYRSLVERSGAQFDYHDGGLEDRPQQLDASLEAADLVICQTGCISHQAYWRVKDYCKRTGKRCVFVENPSTSSLSRQLVQIGAQGLVEVSGDGE